ncbi:hypothetical protein [Nocardioides sp. TF02-7]|uniref:hypothetical protein n=1 Tax=Nocardioides sp. TF02-7 TaxID=2917724 RepID=UPI001F05F72E|nr:hypothetical protein [Nocardioides sp. TF02-7]UMG92320.1 hypothetical protein MF408_20865 [Nocardioides sp. TF02-7]
MTAELEREVRETLRRVARVTDVPPVPELPRPAHGARRRAGVVAVAAAAVAAAVVVPAVLGDDADRPVERPAPPFAGLPTGPPPRVPYAAGGTSVVEGGPRDRARG